MNVGTAAVINDRKTAHKHSSFAPFQAYDSTKKCSALGIDQGFCPWTPLGAHTPDPCYRLALRARHMGLYGHPNLYSLIRSCTVYRLHINDIIKSRPKISGPLEKTSGYVTAPSHALTRHKRIGQLLHSRCCTAESNVAPRNTGLATAY